MAYATFKFDIRQTPYKIQENYPHSTSKRLLQLQAFVTKRQKTMAQRDREPQREVILGDSKITLLGTAHVSRSSAEKVQQLLQGGDYDAVAVELCPSRYNALINPDDLAKMNLLMLLKKGSEFL